MTLRASLVILIVLLCSMSALALEPDQILVIANSDIAKSVQVAEYYCTKRNVPPTNLLALPLGRKLTNTIN
ncbi:MAG: TIGR03790 family protein, partial [Planctomycetota bacterium]